MIVSIKCQLNRQFVQVHGQANSNGKFRITISHFAEEIWAFIESKQCLLCFRFCLFSLCIFSASFVFLCAK